MTSWNCARAASTRERQVSPPRSIDRPNARHSMWRRTAGMSARSAAETRDSKSALTLERDETVAGELAERFAQRADADAVARGELAEREFLTGPEMRAENVGANPAENIGRFRARLVIVGRASDPAIARAGHGALLILPSSAGFARIVPDAGKSRVRDRNPSSGWHGSCGRLPHQGSDHRSRRDADPRRSTIPQTPRAV